MVKERLHNIGAQYNKDIKGLILVRSLGRLKLYLDYV